MLHKIGSQEVTITRELAISFSEMESTPGERALKTVRLKEIGLIISGNDWLGAEWVRVKCNIPDHPLDGKTLRANGNHTSHYFARLDEAEFPEGLTVTIIDWEATEVMDLFRLFDKYDNPTSARSAADKMGQYRANHADIGHLTREFLLQIATGIDFYIGSLEDGIKLRPRQRGQHWDDETNRLFALWCDTRSQDQHSWMMSKKGILAEIYVDYLHDNAKAMKFWTWVMEESHPDPNHESRNLARDFNNMKRKPKVPHATDYRKRAAKGWRKYLAMESLGEVPDHVVPETEQTDLFS